MTVCVSLELSDAHAATEGRRLKRLNGAIRAAVTERYGAS
jgi:hypothetical protein